MLYFEKHYLLIRVFFQNQNSHKKEEKVWHLFTEVSNRVKMAFLIIHSQSSKRTTMVLGFLARESLIDHKNQQINNLKNMEHF